MTKYVWVWRAFDVCYHEPTQKVYISCSLDGSIQVYDSGLDSLLSEIGNLEHPMGLCVHPTANTVWICDRDRQQVIVVDVYSDSIMAAIDLTFSPLDLDMNADGSTVFVCGTGAIVGIDTDSHEVVCSAALPDECRRIKSTADGSQVYAFSDKILWAVSIPGCEIDTLRSAGPGYTSGIDIDHTTNTLYACVLGDGYFNGFAFNTITNEMIDSVFVEGLRPDTDLMVIPGSDYLYNGITVPYGAGTIDVLSRSDFQSLARIDVFMQICRMTTSSSGDLIYATTWSSGLVFLLERSMSR
jgi:DNA-binding beta-propeller fold protein YncE